MTSSRSGQSSWRASSQSRRRLVSRSLKVCHHVAASVLFGVSASMLLLTGRRLRGNSTVLVLKVLLRSIVRDFHATKEEGLKSEPAETLLILVGLLVPNTGA